MRKIKGIALAVTVSTTVLVGSAAGASGIVLAGPGHSICC